MVKNYLFNTFLVLLLCCMATSSASAQCIVGLNNLLDPATGAAIDGQGDAIRACITIPADFIPAGEGPITEIGFIGTAHGFSGDVAINLTDGAATPNVVDLIDIDPSGTPATPQSNGAADGTIDLGDITFSDTGGNSVAAGDNVDAAGAFVPDNGMLASLDISTDITLCFEDHGALIAFTNFGSISITSASGICAAAPACDAVLDIDPVTPVCSGDDFSITFGATCAENSTDAPVAGFQIVYGVDNGAFADADPAITTNAQLIAALNDGRATAFEGEFGDCAGGIADVLGFTNPSCEVFTLDIYIAPAGADDAAGTTPVLNPDCPVEITTLTFFPAQPIAIETPGDCGVAPMVQIGYDLNDDANSGNPDGDFDDPGDSICDTNTGTAPTADCDGPTSSPLAYTYTAADLATLLSGDASCYTEITGSVAADCAALGCGNIEGIVYNDDLGTNNNMFDAGEEVDGVFVELLDMAGNPVDDSNFKAPVQTTSAGGGMYSFMGIPAGNYLVRITPPAGTTAESEDDDDNTTAVTVTAGQTTMAANLRLINAVAGGCAISVGPTDDETLICSSDGSYDITVENCTLDPALGVIIIYDLTAGALNNDNSFNPYTDLAGGVEGTDWAAVPAHAVNNGCGDITVTVANIPTNPAAAALGCDPISFVAAVIPFDPNGADFSFGSINADCQASNVFEIVTTTIFPARFTAVETAATCAGVPSVNITAVNGDVCFTSAGTDNCRDDNTPFAYNISNEDIFGVDIVPPTECDQTFTGTIAPAAECANCPCITGLNEMVGACGTPGATDFQLTINPDDPDLGDAITTYTYTSTVDGNPGPNGAGTYGTAEVIDFLSYNGTTIVLTVVDDDDPTCTFELTLDNLPSCLPPGACDLTQCNEISIEITNINITDVSMLVGGPSITDPDGCIAPTATGLYIGNTGIDADGNIVVAGPGADDDVSLGGLDAVLGESYEISIQMGNQVFAFNIGIPAHDGALIGQQETPAFSVATNTLIEASCSDGNILLLGTSDQPGPTFIGTTTIWDDDNFVTADPCTKDYADDFIASGHPFEIDLAAGSGTVDITDCGFGFDYNVICNPVACQERVCDVDACNQVFVDLLSIEIFDEDAFAGFTELLPPSVGNGCAAIAGFDPDIGDGLAGNLPPDLIEFTIQIGNSTFSVGNLYISDVDVILLPSLNSGMGARGDDDPEGNGESYLLYDFSSLEATCGNPSLFVTTTDANNGPVTSVPATLDIWDDDGIAADCTNNGVDQDLTDGGTVIFTGPFDGNTIDLEAASPFGTIEVANCGFRINYATRCNEVNCIPDPGNCEDITMCRDVTFFLDSIEVRNEGEFYGTPLIDDGCISRLVDEDFLDNAAELTLQLGNQVFSFTGVSQGTTSYSINDLLPDACSTTLAAGVFANIGRVEPGQDSLCLSYALYDYDARIGDNGPCEFDPFVAGFEDDMIGTGTVCIDLTVLYDGTPGTRGEIVFFDCDAGTDTTLVLFYSAGCAESFDCNQDCDITVCNDVFVDITNIRITDADAFYGSTNNIIANLTDLGGILAGGQDIVLPAENIGCAGFAGVDLDGLDALVDLVTDFQFDSEFELAIQIGSDMTQVYSTSNFGGGGGLASSFTQDGCSTGTEFFAGTTNIGDPNQTLQVVNVPVSIWENDGGVVGGDDPCVNEPGLTIDGDDQIFTGVFTVPISDGMNPISGGTVSAAECGLEFDYRVRCVPTACPPPCTVDGCNDIFLNITGIEVCNEDALVGFSDPLLGAIGPGGMQGCADDAILGIGSGVDFVANVDLANLTQSDLLEFGTLEMSIQVGASVVSIQIPISDFNNGLDGLSLLGSEQGPDGGPVDCPSNLFYPTSTVLCGDPALFVGTTTAGQTMFNQIPYTGWENDDVNNSYCTFEEVDIAGLPFPGAEDDDLTGGMDLFTDIDLNQSSGILDFTACGFRVYYDILCSPTVCLPEPGPCNPDTCNLVSVFLDSIIIEDPDALFGLLPLANPLEPAGVGGCATILGADENLTTLNDQELEFAIEIGGRIFAFDGISSAETEYSINDLQTTACSTAPRGVFANIAETLGGQSSIELGYHVWENDDNDGLPGGPCNFDPFSLSTLDDELGSGSFIFDFNSGVDTLHINAGCGIRLVFSKGCAPIECFECVPNVCNDVELIITNIRVTEPNLLYGNPELADGPVPVIGNDNIGCAGFLYNDAEITPALPVLGDDASSFDDQFELTIQIGNQEFSITEFQGTGGLATSTSNPLTEDGCSEGFVFPLGTTFPPSLDTTFSLQVGVWEEDGLLNPAAQSCQFDPLEDDDLMPMDEDGMIAGTQIVVPIDPTDPLNIFDFAGGTIETGCGIFIDYKLRCTPQQCGCSLVLAAPETQCSDDAQSYDVEIDYTDAFSLVPNEVYTVTVTPDLDLVNPEDTAILSINDLLTFQNNGTISIDNVPAGQSITVNITSENGCNFSLPIQAPTCVQLCDLDIKGMSFSCTQDANGVGTDYCVNIDFVGGNTAIYSIEDTLSSNTVVISGDDPSNAPSGTITVCGYAPDAMHSILITTPANAVGANANPDDFACFKLLVGAAPDCDDPCRDTGVVQGLYTCLGANGAAGDELAQIQLTPVNANGVGPYNITAAAGVYSSVDAAGTLTPVATDGSVSSTDLPSVIVVANQPWFVTYTDENGCEITTQGSLQIIKPQLTGLEGQYCTEDPSFVIFDETIFTPGAPVLAGEFSALNAQTGIGTNGTIRPVLDANGDPVPGQAIFDPIFAGPGSQLITYCYDYSGFPQIDDCFGVCDQVVVEIFPVFDPTFEVQDVICVDADPVTLSLDMIGDILDQFNTLEPAFDADGVIIEENFFITWSGPGVCDPVPAIDVDPNTGAITRNTCFGTGAENGVGGANIGTIAENDPAGPVPPETAVREGNGSGTFYPAQAGAGIHTICVEVGYPSCAQEFCYTVEVTATVTANIDPYEACTSPSNAFNLETIYGAGNSAGGTFSLDADNPAPAGISINDEVLIYNQDDITTATAVSVVYEVGNPGTACYATDTAIVTLVPAPQISFDFPDVVCSDEDPLAVGLYLQGQNMANSTILVSATTVADDTVAFANPGMGFVFDPAVIGAGLYDLTYTEYILNPAGTDTLCTFTETEVVEVLQGVGDVAVSDTTVCASSAAFPLTDLITAGTTDGDFSGPGVNAADTTFNPAGLSGVYSLQYCIGDNNLCGGCATVNITVDPDTPADVVAFADTIFCLEGLEGIDCFDLDQNLAFGTPAGGTWAFVSNGANGDYDSEVTVNAAGDAVFTLSGDDAALPLQGNHLCLADIREIILGDPALYLPLVETIDPNGDTPVGDEPDVMLDYGVFTLVYIQPESGVCTSSASFDFVIKEQEACDILMDDVYCETDGILDLLDFISCDCDVMTNSEKATLTSPNVGVGEVSIHLQGIPDGATVIDILMAWDYVGTDVQVEGDHNGYAISGPGDAPASATITGASSGTLVDVDGGTDPTTGSDNLFGQVCDFLFNNGFVDNDGVAYPAGTVPNQGTEQPPHVVRYVINQAYLDAVDALDGTLDQTGPLGESLELIEGNINVDSLTNGCAGLPFTYSLYSNAALWQMDFFVEARYVPCNFGENGLLLHEINEAGQNPVDPSDVQDFLTSVLTEEVVINNNDIFDIELDFLLDLSNLGEYDEFDIEFNKLSCNGCDAFDDHTFLVLEEDAAPEITGLPAGVCTGTDIDLNGHAIPGGGTWTVTSLSGDTTFVTGVDTGAVILSIDTTAGSQYVVTYVAGDIDACGNSNTVQWIIGVIGDDGFAPDVSGPDNLCVDTSAVQFTGVPAGGTWGGDANADGTFVPDSVGVFTLTYTVESDGNCTDGPVTVQYFVTVVESTAPSVDIHGIPALACIDDVPTVALDDSTHVNPVGLGGIWTVNGDTLTGTFTPDSVGNYLFSYTATVNDVCQGEVVVTTTWVLSVVDSDPGAPAIVGLPGEICINEDPITLSAANISPVNDDYADGNWTVNGVTTTTVNFNQIGFITVTYTGVVSDPCDGEDIPVQVDWSIEVKSSDPITPEIEGVPAVICESAEDILLTGTPSFGALDSISGITLVFSGNGVTDDGEDTGNTATYTPTAAGNVDTITYTVTYFDVCLGNTTASVTILVTVVEDENIQTVEDNAVCQSTDDYSINLTQYLAPGPVTNGGTFQVENLRPFINEIDYDGDQVFTEEDDLDGDGVQDANEVDPRDFIEIAGAAGTDLKEYLLVLYTSDNDFATDHIGEGNGRMYAVISPALGYGWYVPYDDEADTGNNDPDADDDTPNQWCNTPDDLEGPDAAVIYDDPDVFQIFSVGGTDFVIDAEHTAANGAEYGAVAVELREDGDIKDGPSAIALVRIEDFDNYTTPGNGLGVCDAEYEVVQFVGYGTDNTDAENPIANGDPNNSYFDNINGDGCYHVGAADEAPDPDFDPNPDDFHTNVGNSNGLNTNSGIFAACDGPAATLVSTDINVVDNTNVRSVQFTNDCWVIPNVTDAEVNYPNVANCNPAAPGAVSSEDESPGFLNWGQLAPDMTGESGCDGSSAEEFYFDYIAPNGDILNLANFCQTLFVGGLVAQEDNLYTDNTDGDPGSNPNADPVSFDFTKNQVLPITFSYETVGGSLCQDEAGLVNLYILMHYQEWWEAPEFLCENSDCGPVNLNTLFMDSIQFIPPDFALTGSYTESNVVDCEENGQEPFISEIHYQHYTNDNGFDGSSADEHCVTYNYINVGEEFDPTDDRYETAFFCEGFEIAGLTGQDLSCYTVVFYREDVAGEAATGLLYDVTYIGEDGIPVTTDVENGILMNLWGNIDSDEGYEIWGYNPVTGTSQIMTNFDNLEILTVPSAFYNEYTAGTELDGTFPNFNGPCGVVQAGVDYDAGCTNPGGPLDPDGDPTNQAGLYFDIDGNGEYDHGTDLLIFTDNNDNGEFDAGEETLTGDENCEEFADESFPWERLSLASCDANDGYDEVGARWFPVLDIAEGGAVGDGAAIGLFNRCTGETFELLSWNTEFCIENANDFTLAGPFQQQTTTAVDTTENANNNQGDLRSLQLISCCDVPANLFPCSGCQDENDEVWVVVFDGGAIDVPGCGEIGQTTDELVFSNSYGYYNCNLKPQAAEPDPCVVEVTIDDEDIPDNYLITDHIVTIDFEDSNDEHIISTTWEVGDRVCGIYQESDNHCHGCEGGCYFGTNPDDDDFPEDYEIHNGNGICDFAFEGYCTKKAERTYYFEANAAVHEFNTDPAVAGDTCRAPFGEVETYGLSLSVTVNYRQCFPTGSFFGQGVSLNLDNADDPYWELDASGLCDFSPLEITYDAFNSNGLDADEATDDLTCVDPQTAGDRKQAVRVICSDAAALGPDEISACISDGQIDLEQYLAAGSTGGVFSIEPATPALSGNHFNPDQAEVGVYTLIHTTNANSSCRNTDSLTIVVEDGQWSFVDDIIVGTNATVCMSEPVLLSTITNVSAPTVATIMAESCVSHPLDTPLIQTDVAIVNVDVPCGAQILSVNVSYSYTGGASGDADSFTLTAPTGDVIASGNNDNVNGDTLFVENAAPEFGVSIDPEGDWTFEVTSSSFPWEACLTVTVEYLQGTFSGNGVTYVGDGEFQFDPAGLQVFNGGNGITYSVGCGACTGVTNPLFVRGPEFFPPSFICVEDGDINLAQFIGNGTDPNGTFSTDCGLGTVNDTFFTPTAAGECAVTYTTDECSITRVITILGGFSTAWDTEDNRFTYCENEMPKALVNPTGEAWLESTLGDWTVFYDGSGVDSLITINRIDTIFAEGDTTNTIIEDYVVEVLFGEGLDLGGFDHVAYGVTYSGGGGSCKMEQTSVINVYAIPDAPFVDPTEQEICGSDVLEIANITTSFIGPFPNHTFHVYNEAGELIQDGEMFNADTFDPNLFVPRDEDGIFITGTYQFFVHEVNLELNHDVCESDPTIITIVVFPPVEFQFEIGCTDPETGNAAIQVTGLGGVGPYEISINGGDFFDFVPDQTLNVLVPGVNEVVIRDVNGCLSATQTILVDDVANFEAIVSCPDEDGNVTVTIDPTDDTKEYQVSTDAGATYGEFGELELTVNANEVTNLEIRVRDEDGCESPIKDVVLNDPITFNTQVSCPDENGNVTVTVIASSTNAVVLVNGSPVDGLNFTVPAGSTANVIVQDGGCESAPVSVDTAPAVAIDVDLDCPEFDPFNQTSSTDATVTVTGGTAPYTVFVNGQPAGQTNGSVELEDLAAGTYTVSATDADGCAAADEIITVVDMLTLTLNKEESTLLVCGEGDIRAVVGGVDNVVSYAWSFDPAGDNLIPDAGSSNVYVTAEIFGARVIYVRGLTANGCETAPLAISLYHYEEFTVGAGEPVCDEETGTYTITFTLGGGRNTDFPPYSVDGEPIEGNTWTSGPIVSGQPYFFVFDDNNTGPSCEAIIVQGSVTCTCAADAGTLTPLQASNNVSSTGDGLPTFCNEDNINVEVSGFNDNPGQVEAFIVTDGTTIVDLTQAVGSEADFFGLAAGTYQLWALNYTDGDAVIPGIGGSTADLDGCFNLSAPVEFAVLEPIVIDAIAQCTTDNESGFEVVVSITGGRPEFDGAGSYQINFITDNGSTGVVYINGAGSATINGVDNNITLGSEISIAVSNDGALCESDPVVVAIPTDCAGPVAAPDSENTEEGTAVTFNVTDNDSGEEIRVTAVTEPANGTIQWNADGTFTYVPNDGFTGTEIVVYQITDANGMTANATVVITVEGVGTIQVDVNRDCSNADVTGQYTVTIIITEGTPPYSVSGSLNESGIDANDPRTVIIDDGVGYVFTITDAAGDTFTLDESDAPACTKVAVELLDYTGEVLETGNDLTWITASEVDNDFFTLAHSVDGQNFTQIAQLDGQGTTSEMTAYNFLHKGVGAGVHYYRLVSTDLDGTTEDHGVITLVRGEVSFNFVNVYPIPATELVTVDFTSPAAQSVTVEVFNMTGQVVETVDVDAVAGVNQVNLNIAKYAVGAYFVTINDGEAVQTTKIIKE